MSDKGQFEGKGGGLVQYKLEEPLLRKKNKREKIKLKKLGSRGCVIVSVSFCNGILELARWQAKLCVGSSLGSFSPICFWFR